jgi:hypothetical protein
MQVLVPRAKLSGNDAVSVVGMYEDDRPIPAEMRRSDLAVLNVPTSALEMSERGPELKAGWHETELRERRVSPLQAQVASLAELIGFVLAHGADASKWPDAARRRRAEIERAFKS